MLSSYLLSVLFYLSCQKQEPPTLFFQYAPQIQRLSSEKKKSFDRASALVLSAENQEKEQAIKTYQEASELFIQALGRNNDFSLQAQNNLALLYLDAEPEQTQAALERIQQSYERYNRNSVGYHHVLFNLGSLYYQQHQYDLALRFFEELLYQQELLLGKYHPLIQPTLDRLVEIHLYRGEPEASIALLEREIKFHRRADGINAAETLAAKSLLGNIYVDLAEFSQARKLLETTLEKQLDTLGEDHPDVWSTWHHLGHYHRALGNIELAKDFYERALEKRRSHFELVHPDTLSSINNIALLYTTLGEFERAETLLDEALKAQSQLLGKTHPNTLGIVNNTAYLYLEEGRFFEARKIFEQTLKQEQMLLGVFHPDSLTTLNNVGNAYLSLGDFDQAETVLEKSVQYSLQHYGEQHPKTLVTKNNLGQVYIAQARYEEAEQLLQDVLSRQASMLGAKHPERLTTLSNMGNLLLLQSRYESAKMIFQEELSLAKSLPQRHPSYLQALRNQAYLLLVEGKASESEQKYQELLALQIESFGELHPNVLQSMREIGYALQSQGQYQQAESYFQNILSLQQKSLGENHPSVIKTSYTLASLFELQGKYEKSEPLLLRNILISKGVFGAGHPITLQAVSNLARLYTSQGRYPTAETLFLRNLKRLEADFGAGHAYTLFARNGLANVYLKQEEYEKAYPLFQKLLEDSKQALGEEHPNTVQALGSLAQNAQLLGRYDEAEPLLQDTLRLQETTLGEAHPNTLITKNNLAQLYLSQGKYKDAESLLLTILERQRIVLGKEHPSTLTSLYNLSVLYAETKDINKAIRFATELADGEESFLRRNSTGSEEARAQFFRTFNTSTSFIIALHLHYAPDNKDAQALAFQTWLRRKARVLDAQVDTLQNIKRNLDSEGQRLLSQRKQLHLQESALREKIDSLDPEQYQQNMQQVLAQLDEVERQLAQKSKSFAREKQPVRVEDLTAILEKDAAMVQFVVYTPKTSQIDKRQGHLAAYLLQKDGTIVSADLGDLSKYLPRLQAFRQTRSQTLARQLYRELLAPLFSQMSVQPRQLFISPDGPLNLIPFGLLQPEKGSYLSETTAISYLSTGRDILHYSEPVAQNTNPPVIIANPDYGSQSKWIPLRGTQKEADRLKTLFPAGVLYSQEDASVEQIRALNSPRWLHIATHGFMTPDNPHRLSDDNPMSRSGLVFASQDGKVETELLATEAVNLNLQDTDLVVLSACESGLGQASNGEGIYGLRRAITLAGARSQLVSLWPVNDEATAFFMEKFYALRSQGSTKIDALQQTKQQMRAHPRWNSSVFWGGFILVGDWN